LDSFRRGKLKERRFKMIGRKVLFSKILSVLLVGLGCLSFLGCGMEKEEPVSYEDLVMVNLSTISVPKGFGGSSMGVYVLFFEDHPTRVAYLDQVAVKFDAILNEPTVEAMLRLKSHYKQNVGKLFNVVITFKNKEQMLEYWLVNR
jgi:hypothetical protein